MRKEWNFFREKVLSFVGSFFDFLAGEQKKDFDEEGRESERHVCPKERKKDSPSLSLSLSSRWWWWWWWLFKRRHYREHVVADDSFPPIILLLPFPFFPSPLQSVTLNGETREGSSLKPSSLFLLFLLLLLFEERKLFCSLSTRETTKVREREREREA